VTASTRRIAQRSTVVAIASIAVAFTLVGVPMGIATLDQYGPTGAIFILIFPAIVLSLTLVGGFVAWRVPTNPVGWLLELAGLGSAVGIFGGTYVNYDHATSAGLPLVIPLAWLSGFAILPAIGILMIYIPLLFPTGRFLSWRWRRFGLLGLVGAVASVLGGAFAPGPLSSASWIDNPLGIPGAADALATITLLSNLATPVFFFGAVASVFVRYRRAGQVERQQLKWFGLTACSAVMALVISIPNNGPVSDIAWEVGLAILPLLPVSIGIAVLRYHLWDIDRIVSRTIGWAVVTGLLVALFAIAIAGADAVLAGVTQGQTLAVAASTLLAASLFQPLRGRVQHLVDRRFDRARYDGEWVVASFGERLRGHADPTAVEREIETAVRDALRPGSAAVWVRRGGTR
jgi:MFS family permease